MIILWIFFWCIKIPIVNISPNIDYLLHYFCELHLVMVYNSFVLLLILIVNILFEKFASISACKFRSYIKFCYNYFDEFINVAWKLVSHTRTLIHTHIHPSTCILWISLCSIDIFNSLIVWSVSPISISQAI